MPTPEDSARDRALPADVTVLLVQSLFRDSGSLVVGGTTTTLGLAFTYHRTGAGVFVGLAALTVIVVAIRIALNVAFARLSIEREPLSTAFRWEWAYGILATLHCAILGAWCFICLWSTDDAVSRLLSAVVTVGCASAIPGRNFGRVGIATAQVIALSVPLSLGWIVQGDRSYLFLAALILPFFAALRTMSRRLQGTLVDALTTHHALGGLADTFAAALDNMPHGLCVVDRSGEVTVANRRILEMASPTPSRADPAPDAGSFVATVAGRGAREPDAAELAQVRRVVEAGTSAGGTITLPDGAVVELTAGAMADGGRVVVAEDVTARRDAEARILRLARTDPLTGVANRAHFVDAVRADLAAGEACEVHCAVLFVDIDKFKLVNDTLGHGCGDRLLVAVAGRLAGLAGEGGLVGRFGGDEFVLYRPRIERPGEASDLAEAILEAVSGPLSLEGGAVRPAASVGIATAPRGVAEVDLLVRRADLALYRAKVAGRARWSVYDAAMDREAERRGRLEIELQGALAAGALELHYQPLFETGRLGLASCEALLRWRHPTRGLVPPAEFIPIAEGSGLITEIGAAALRWACDECRRWPGDVRVAVNMSSVQFAKSDVVATVRDALAASGLAPQRLEVEITESVLLQDTDTVARALAELRAMGVALSLDDFGTGHSSLSTLHRFPFDRVKMDRSFVADVVEDARSFSLLEGVSDLSRKLGLSVVVEGIETREQLDAVLRMKGVSAVQGFLLGRPMPPVALTELLRAPLDSAA